MILLGGGNKCPPNNICLSSKHFYIILFILFLFIIYKFWNHKNKSNNDKQIINKQENKYEEKQENKYEEKQENYNRHINLSLLKKYLENRDKSILSDPLIAPERRVPYEQYPNNIKNLINIPTRGYPDNYQLLGLLSRDEDEKILQLYGRPTYPGSNEFEYYATTEQNGFINKIPFHIKGKREIEDHQNVEIPILKGNFKVKLYNYDTPRYYP
jgi:hypothetical protein